MENCRTENEPVEKDKILDEVIAYKKAWDEHINELGRLAWHLKPAEYIELGQIRARLEEIARLASLNLLEELKKKAGC